MVAKHLLMTHFRRLAGCFALCILLSPIVIAQTLDRSTINAAGASGNLSDGDISYSIGELFVNTESGGSILLTQGFQQPTFLVEEPEPELGLEDISETVEVYPNPTRDYVRFKTAQSLEEFTIQLYNLSGQLIQLPISRNQEVELDLRSLRAGEYFIRLSKDEKFALFKLIKH